jgi:uncharacterized protein with HEPN domain
MEANNPEVLNLITKYKACIAKTKLQDEVYKWKLVKQFKGRPDTNASDFASEYKAIKYANLMYQLSAAVGNHIGRENPEAFRQLFIYLFDETKSLEERIIYFNEESLKIYRSIGGEKGHHQDERAISTYLTVHNPEKYTFYKSGFYLAFCKLIGVTPAGKNQKYIHYLELVNQFIEQYIIPDSELIETVKSFIPEYYDGTNHLLLAQDILYCMFNKSEEEVNYWIFQGNQKIYNVTQALQDNILKSWSVKSHKESIQIGDKVILWVSGNNAGCYALAEIVSDVFEAKDDDSEMIYYVDNRSNEISNRVSIKITHNLSSNPILKEQIQGIEALIDLKAGSQGTNFKATQIEYNTFLNLAEKHITNRKFWLYAPGENANKWEEFYQEGIMALGWDELGDLRNYQTQEDVAVKLREIESTESSKMNDSKANFEFVHSLKKGDIIFVKKGNTKLLGYGEVCGNAEFDNNNTTYKNYRKVDWKLNGEWDAGHTLVQKTLTDITKYKTELNGFNHYYERLFACMENGQSSKIKPMAINQILYGPPGTGKTYTLKTEYFPKYITKEINLTKEQHIENVIRELTWWQVIAIVVLKQGKTKVGSMLNHPWMLQKAKLSNSNTIRPTLWGQLQSHTVPTCDFVNVKAKQQPFIFNKTEDSYWEIVQEELKEHAPEIYDLVDSLENFKPDASKEIKRYVFTTFHQSFNYEDFIEGIKPVLSENQESSDVSYQIEDGIFKALCKRAESDPENRYAIFIDEINRGNVSNIFGELITLIEHDKRKGAEHAMSATLPYSKKVFSVPSNVDIYGTMNTADRSVEALDSALRRRFSFTEMLPQPDLIKTAGPLKASYGILNGIDLSVVLTTINKRIEKLLDKDHQIGHSYFLQVANIDQLKQAFQSSIIPLLQEYFFGDYGKIGLVLGQGFFAVQEPSNDENFFAEFNDYELDGILDMKVYHLIDVTLLDDASFTELLLAILPRS